ncbi:MAG: LysE family translocator [Pseudomonadota bacterium]
MDYQLLTALALFAFASFVTPGPNNLMLMASGANFGLRRTVPHMLGIALGHAFMALLIALGLAQVFTAWPPAETGLKVACVLYMLWLAWKIAHAAAPGAGASRGRPLTFLQAAAFQWVNPKAWAIALAAVAIYAPGTGPWLLAAMFVLISLPSISVWAWLGQQLRRMLTSPRRLRAFNWTMAVLLIASLWPVLRM